MPKKRLHKRYTSEQRQAAAEIMEEYRLAAERGELRMREMHKIEPVQMFLTNAVYWRNVKQGLAWVIRSIVPIHKESKDGESPSSSRDDSRRSEDNPDRADDHAEDGSQNGCSEPHGNPTNGRRIDGSDGDSDDQGYAPTDGSDGMGARQSDCPQA